MNSKTLFNELLTFVKSPDREEARAILYCLLEKQPGLSKTDIALEREVEVSQESYKDLISKIERINRHEPVQYITGECEFFGKTFAVTPAVLIPRPETEELVRIVLNFFSSKEKPLNILDIATGSGCIAATLALQLKHSNVTATDVSKEALTIAQDNSVKLNASVKFIRHDVLLEDLPKGKFDIIVSNPPYISEREKQNMEENVLLYEPHLALFVQDDDPLLFYRVILSKAMHALNPEGMVAVEINERYGPEVTRLFHEHRFSSTAIHMDISGKDRIVYGFMESS